MLYRIGEVSQLFGLTNETLRNYERAGIIHSERLEGSRYRYYDIENVSKLFGIRAHRNEGFTVKELEAVYTDISFENYEMLIHKKIHELEREQYIRQLQLERMREIQQTLKSIKTCQDQYVIMESPDLYIFPYRVGQDLNDLKLTVQRIAEWTENMMLITNSAQYTLNQVDYKAQGFEVCLAVKKTVADILELDLSPPVRYLPKRLCVHCYCERDHMKYLWDKQYLNIASFLDQNTLKICADPFTLTAGTFRQNNTRRSFVELFVPVQNR